MESSDTEVEDVYKFKDCTSNESEICDLLKYCYKNVQHIKSNDQNLNGKLIPASRSACPNYNSVLQKAPRETKDSRLI